MNIQTASLLKSDIANVQLNKQGSNEVSMQAKLREILLRRKLLISTVVVAVILILGALIVAGRSDKSAQVIRLRHSST